jgi:RepB DNA-primase from phage plasmid/Transposase
MNSLRYIGLDVHQDTVSAAVLDRDGKLLMQYVFATRAAAILDFLHGIKGTLHITFEEGVHSAWLYDLLQRRVARVLVCDPRKNKLLKSGNKGDLIDARKLAELLRNNSLSPVYHGGMNPLKNDAATRTKEDIESIKHVYLDVDHGGSEALEAIENSSAVPKPNYVLNSSPDKHQVVWKVEGMDLEEAEDLLHAMAREFGGDPAATDATRVLRLPGFANKKYDTDFYVEARRGSHGNVPSSRF